MIQYILRRLILVFPVFLGILLATFVLTRLIPGDPCIVMLGERATPEKCADFRQRYGLNDNVMVQFGRYMVNMAKGDFGTSIRYSRPVVDIISERLPVTIELATGALIFSVIVGVSLGLVAALKRNSIVDVITMIIANIGISMPIFWLGLMLAYLFAIILKGTPIALPPSGRLESGLALKPLAEAWHLGNLQGFPKFFISCLSNSYVFNGLVTGNFKVLGNALTHLILPCVTVGTIPLAVLARMTRSSLLEVLGQDYIRTARAKGLIERRVIFRHALRNAMIPISTTIGLEAGILLSGAVLTETTFSLPGMGTQLVEAIQARDYPLVQATVFVIAVIFVVINLVVDLSYAYLDPRIRLE